MHDEGGSTGFFLLAKPKCCDYEWKQCVSAKVIVGGLAM
jgi:hypothetical protein